MRERSVYEFECVGCGQRITTEANEVTCPGCGAQIRLEWRESQLPVASCQLSDEKPNRNG